MRMSDIYLDKLIDKFIKEMEDKSLVTSDKEKELYLVDVDDNNFTFKEVRRLI